MRIFPSVPRALAICRRFIPMLLLTMGGSVGASAAPSYTWRNVVIKGGGFVSGLSYHSAQQGILYARTDVGGAFRWEPATSAWQPLNDDLGKDDSQLTGVVSIALDRQLPNVVYLACGQYLPSWAQHGAILRSADRGQTWTRTNLGINLGGNSDGRSTGERLQVDPNSSGILFLGTNQDGLWKSTDSGQTWNKVSTFSPASVTLVCFDRSSGTAGSPTPTIYVGVNTLSSPSLFRSTDGGTNWSAIPGQPSGLMPHHAEIGSDGVLYVAFNNGLGPNGITTGAVWKMRTSDGIWTNISPGLTNSGGYGGLSLDAQHPGTLVVSTIDYWSVGDDVFRSTDGGATWKSLKARSVRDTSSAPYAAASTPHWIGDIEIDPFNSDRAFYITGYGLFSTDNLTTADGTGQIAWSFRNDGLEETVPLGLVSPPSGAPLVSVIGDIDGFKHDDLSVSPARGRHSPSVGTNRSIDFAELAPAKMVRTHDGGTVRGSMSTDGGATWTYFASAPPSAAAQNQGNIAISADGSRIVWAPTHAIAYYSSNNGATWTASSGGPAASSTADYVPVSDRVNSNKFYLYDPVGGRMYVSADGGATFAAAANGLPTGANPPRAVYGNEGHLWLTAWNSGLYRSTDSGATFSKVSGVAESNRIGFGKAGEGRTYPAIYLWAKTGGINGLYRSDDVGGSWTRINDDAHQFGWINAVSGDPRTYGRVYLATGGRGIVYGDAPLADGVPAITDQPKGHTIATGSTVVLEVTATGNNLTYQWSKGGVALPGATSRLLLLSNLQTSDAGNYTVSVSNSAGSMVSTAAALTVSATSDAGRIINVSVRTTTGVANDVLIVGFVTGGPGTTGDKEVLIRGLGPRLADFGVPNVLVDPFIDVIPNQAGVVSVATNDNWSGDATVSSTALAIGATALTNVGSKDAAKVIALPAGPYSVKISGVNNTTGTTLAEVYDTVPAAGPASMPRLINISARAQMSNDNPIIAGFVITGSTAKTVMIRGIGPYLEQYLGAAVMADPSLKVFVQEGPNNRQLTANDDWGGAAQIGAVTQSTGAFALTNPASKDAVLLLTLDPGVYSAQVNGANNSSGIALLEVYAIP